MRIIAFICVVTGFIGPVHADLIITGILDGTASGGEPKAIEIYVDGTENLTSFTIQRSTNSNLFSTETNLGTITGLSNVTDSFIYLLGTGDSPEFASAFGALGDFSSVFESTIISGNGNDAFRIRTTGGTVIDQIGFESDATSFYADSWGYRSDNTGPDGLYVPANWTFGGNDALDGLSLAEIGSAVPLGTYSVSSVPEPSAFLFGSLVCGVLGMKYSRKRKPVVA